MTDARFPERWLHDRRYARLEPLHFKSFVTSLAWAVGNLTDGRVEPDDLPLIAGFDDSSVRVLVAAGVWEELDDAAGWMIVDFLDTQVTRTQMEGLKRKRALDRERQARKRARERGSEPERDDQRDVTRDGARDTEDRTGQDRQQLRDEVLTTAQDDELTSTWPDLPTPGSPSVATPEGESVCHVCGKALAPYYVTAGRSTHPGCF